MPRQQKATQLYVGKIFSLKKAKGIEAYKTNGGDAFKLGLGSGECLGPKTWEEIGPNVLVLAEKGKTVEVLSPNFGPVWIPKFYLHTEIREMLTDNPEGELGKIITELTGVRELLSRCWSPKKHDGNMKNVDKSLKTVNKLIRRVRLVQETLESKRESG